MHFIKYGTFIVILIATTKLGFFILRRQYFETLCWLVFSGVIAWIVWAYANNKDIPSYGSTRYENGSNQLARSIFTIVMVGIFVIGTLVA